jgi:ABC-type uncharacterized transport system substrate-binding protein
MTWRFVQSCLLGVVLIAALAALLLLSDLGSRTAHRTVQPKANVLRRITLIQLVEAPAIRATREGMITGLAQAGLLEGRDYTLIQRDAQGDISMLGNLVDAARVDDADLILTITTPALQTVMQRVSDVPVVFGLALDPLLVGDDGTHDNHRANFAGIFDRSPFEAAMALVRECLPDAQTIGTLYNPAEINSVAFRQDLETAAAAVGLRCVSLPVSAPADVADAAAALAQHDVDVITQINDNLNDASFAGIAQSARRARVPLFSFTSEMALSGQAILALSNDHHDAGREAGLIAARVLHGESPADIPYRSSTFTRLIVNLRLAREAGLALPPAVLARADQIVEN